MRMVLRAVSTASAPVFMGRIISLPVISESFLAKRGHRSLKNAREVRVSTSAWSFRAWMILGCRCPWFTAE